MTFTNNKIKYFAEKFNNYGNGHIIFASHAVFSIIVTPDLLYKLWANFKKYNNKGEILYIDKIAVSDFLLSNLCKKIGNDQFEIYTDVRSELLKYLNNETQFGDIRIQELAKFLYQYTLLNLNEEKYKFIKKALTWTSLATISPKQAAWEISNELVKSEKDHEILEISDLLENYVQQNDNFNNLHQYTKGLKANIYNEQKIAQQEFNKVFSISPHDNNVKFKIPISKTTEKLYTFTDKQVEIISEIDIINKLGKELNVEFMEVNISEISKYELIRAKYSLNKNGDIVGLCLANYKLKKVPEQIANFKKIARLNLYNNHLSDVSTLKKLKYLTILDLRHNQLSNISALNEIKSLTTIYLMSNQISDISGVRNLKKLEIIDLRLNPINHLESWICDFPKMNIQWNVGWSKKYITFYDNPIESTLIEIVKQGKGAIKNWFENNKTDLDFIKEFEEELEIEFSVVDISKITKFKSEKTAEYSTDRNGNITGLCIVYFELKEIPKSISTCLHLISLNLKNNQISDISALKELKKLTELRLFDNQISNISALRRLRGLVLLDLRKNPIKELPEWICNFPKMGIQWKNSWESGFITFFDNPIDEPPIMHIKLGIKSILDWFQKNKTDLHILKEFENKLEVSFNEVNNDEIIKWKYKKTTNYAIDKKGNIIGLQIEKLNLLNIPLEIREFKNLIHLNLHGNRIKDISLLGELGNIKALNLGNNQVNNIEGLAELEYLQMLWLDNNQIIDISELKKLIHINVLDLRRNPITEIPIWLTDFDSDIKWGDNWDYDCIIFFDNPIDNPPIEIVKLGRLAIKEWLKGGTSDIDVIKELEAELKIESEKVSVPANRKFSDSPKVKYSIDKYGKVTEIFLSYLDLKRVPINLKKCLHLEVLNLQGNNFIDISGIENLKSLTELNLSDSSISDISALKGLKGLTKLNLSSNIISDISALKELKSLKILNLEMNRIWVIVALKELKKLTELNLRYNRVLDILALKELKRLKKLDLRKNPILNLFSWVGDFPKMDIQWGNSSKDGFITFYENPFKNPPVEIVKKGKEEIKKWFEENISDIEIIKELEKQLNTKFAKVDIFKIIEFKSDKIAEYSVDQNGNITGLCIVYFDLKEIPKNIEKFLHLISFNLQNNQISDISALKKLGLIEKLDLSHNRIADISLLPKSENLTYLSLHANLSISELSYLAYYKKLEELYLSYNKLEDISAISELKKLTKLSLLGNKIKDIEALKKLTKLNFLNLGGNNFENIIALKDLTNLNTLGVAHCPIKSLPEWVCDFDMGFLTETTENNLLKEGFISFFKNPIETPPLNIIKKGKARTKKWFQQNEKTNEKIKKSISQLAGSKFIKNWKLENKDTKLSIYFVESYEEFKKARPKGYSTFKDYRDYFNTGDQINKILMKEPIRFLKDFDDLEFVYLKLTFGIKTYEIEINRKQIEEYLQLSINDLKNEDYWRREFIDKKAYNKEYRKEFVNNFVSQSKVENHPEDGSIYVHLKGETKLYELFPEEVASHEKQIGDKLQCQYKYSIENPLGEIIEIDFWEYPGLTAENIVIENSKLLETTNNEILSQFQNWLYEQNNKRNYDKTRKILGSDENEIYVKIKGEKEPYKLLLIKEGRESLPIGEVIRYESSITLKNGQFIEFDLFENFYSQDADESMEISHPNLLQTTEREIFEQFQNWLDSRNVEKFPNIEFEKFKEEKYDAPLKSQIDQSILVKGTFTREEFEAKFQDYANKLKKEKSKYHDEQTHLWLYFFDNKSRASTNWFSRYEYIDSSSERFYYNDTLMKMFDNGDNTFSVLDKKNKSNPKQFGTVIEMLSKFNDYRLTEGTLKVISSNHIQISDNCVKGDLSSVIEESVKRGLIYITFQVFIHTDTDNIVISSIPLQVDFKDKNKQEYLFDYAKTISINRKSALEILRQQVKINSFDDLVESDNNDSITRNFNSMMYNDAGKPTLNVIWKELEQFLIEYQPDEDYYIPERDIPLESLKRNIENLEWDYKKGEVIIYMEEFDYPSILKTLEELVQYLDEEIVQALNAEMPIDWLKEQEIFDYDTEVREYLYNNCKKEIEKLGWAGGL